MVAVITRIVSGLVGRNPNLRQIRIESKSRFKFITKVVDAIIGFNFIKETGLWFFGHIWLIDNF